MGGVIFLVGFFIFIGVGVTILTMVLRIARTVQRTTESQAVRTVVEIAKNLTSHDVASVTMNKEEAPKSVSDMTAVYSGNIARDFPDLNVRELITSAEHKLSLYLAAVGNLSQQAVEKRILLPRQAYEQELEGGGGDITLGITDALVTSLEQRIAGLHRVGSVESFENISIRHTGIRSYRKQGATCVLVLQTAVSYYHYIKRDFRVIAGSTDLVDQARYDLELIYVIDKDQLPFEDTDVLSAHCPNCGAPVKGTGDKFCEFCGSGIHTIDIRLWRVNKFSES